MWATLVRLGARLRPWLSSLWSAVRVRPGLTAMVMILAVVTGYGWVQKGRLDRLEALRLEEKVGALEADRKALRDQIRGLEGKVAKATAEAAKATAELARVRTKLGQVNQQLAATQADRAAVKAATDALAGRPLKELQDAYERMGYHPRPALRPR